MLEEQARSEWNIALAAKFDRGADRVFRRIELPRFVKLAVVGQIGFRHDAENPSAANYNGAVEQQVIDFERRSDDRNQGHRDGSLDGTGDPVTTSVEQGALMEKIVAAIGRQAEFRKQSDYSFAIGRGTHEGDRLIGVEGRIGHAHRRNSDGCPDEAVIVEVEEI